MSEKPLAHPLKWWQFYIACIRYAGSGVLGVIGDAGTVLGVAIFAFKHAFSTSYAVAGDWFLKHGFREDILIEGPLWVGAAILILRLLASPFAIYRDKPAVETGGPDIQIVANGFYQDTRQFRQKGGPVPKFLKQSHGLDPKTPSFFATSVDLSFLHLRVINQPHGIPTEKSIAKDVIARIHYSNSDGKEMFFVDGRWGDTTQPTALPAHAAAVDLLAITIPVGQIRELDIAMMYPGQNEAYAFNNDSYNCDRLCNAAWALPRGDYSALVEIIAPYIARAWRVRFRVGERLEALGWESVGVTP